MQNNTKVTSQYSITPVKDWYLDIWTPRPVPVSEFDKIIIIPPEYNQRPDLMSNAEYGTPRLWWIFAMRNPNLIIDPINDFVSGLEIYIPINILGQ